MADEHLTIQIKGQSRRTQPLTLTSRSKTNSPACEEVSYPLRDIEVTMKFLDEMDIA